MVQLALAHDLVGLPLLALYFAHAYTLSVRYNKTLLVCDWAVVWFVVTGFCEPPWPPFLYTCVRLSSTVDVTTGLVFGSGNVFLIAPQGLFLYENVRIATEPAYNASKFAFECHSLASTCSM